MRIEPTIREPIAIKTAAESVHAKEHGAWVTIEAAPGWRFKLCRVGTDQYTKERRDIAVSRYGLDYSAANEDEITALWLARYGVTDWECPQGHKFSEPNASELFLNESYYHSVNLQLMTKGLDYRNYLESVVEKDIEAVKKP